MTRSGPPRSARPPHSALTPPRRKSLGDDVADRLREAILHGELSAGQRLREEELADRLQVSRGPVRDAFVCLEREGLIRSSRHRGVTVMELTLRDLHEIYTLRSALEPLAVSLAMRRGSDADLAGIESALEEFTAAMSPRISERTAAELDVQFHDAIYRAARHERLYRAWSEIRMPAYWFMLSRNVGSKQWRAETASGHTRIVVTIRSGEQDAAREAISEHIRTGFSRIEASYLQAFPVGDGLGRPDHADFRP
ncbi:MAG TPA: GntR family transcriptional regulator [Streptosporangiaceae bacterium]|nr:GntR family transcriptional regulator [Streptosporangiaceae bacterium]